MGQASYEMPDCIEYTEGVEYLAEQAKYGFPSLVYFINCIGFY